MRLIVVIVGWACAGHTRRVLNRAEQVLDSLHEQPRNPGLKSLTEILLAHRSAAAFNPVGAGVRGVTVHPRANPRLHYVSKKYEGGSFEPKKKYIRDNPKGYMRLRDGTGKVLGTVEFELLAKEAPMECGNFIELVDRGFYDGLPFHRVVPGAFVQTGCPLSRDHYNTSLCGKGHCEPFSTFIHWRTRETIVRDKDGRWPDEFIPSYIVSNRPGTMAFANVQCVPDSSSSQFFINLGQNTYLDWFNRKTKMHANPFALIQPSPDSHCLHLPLLISQGETDDRHRPLDPIYIDRITVDVSWKWNKINEAYEDVITSPFWRKRKIGEEDHGWGDGMDAFKYKRYRRDENGKY